MGAKSLGSRAIIGEFYMRLEQDLGANLGAAGIDDVPIRSGIGGLQMARHGAGDAGVDRRPAGEGIPRERDHHRQQEIRVHAWRSRSIGCGATRPGRSWCGSPSRPSARTPLGEAPGSRSSSTARPPLCYDGQFFFDTDHSRGRFGYAGQRHRRRYHHDHRAHDGRDGNGHPQGDPADHRFQGRSRRAHERDRSEIPGHGPGAVHVGRGGGAR